MGTGNKVVWSDGLLVKPHHFQQQNRYVERLTLSMISRDDAHFYGLATLALDEELLGLGKVSILTATGIMPDGTVFDIPAQDKPPEVLDLTTAMVAGETIWLCVPLESAQGIEVQAHADNGSDVGARYVAGEIATRDNTVQAGELAALQVSQLRPVLKRGSDDLSAFARLAIARVVDKTGEGAAVLDKSFLPTMISISAEPTLRRFLRELAEGVTQRAAAIAQRIGKPDQNGVAEVSDFMLLQRLNSIGPELHHMVRMERLHPRIVYERLITMVGELSTFMSANRLVPELPAYEHMEPSNCWPGLIQTLRQMLTATLVANAVPIPHERRAHGYVVAPVHERDLMRESEFVLAIKANVPQERLHRDFIAQSKVASIEQIRELVQKQLPGIPMRLMPVAPRQLPYHAGYSYFALERHSAAWAQMDGSSGFAFHIAGTFPELEMQFWAIKG